MEQSNSKALFMTDEQFAEYKRKQADMHARLIAAFPEPKSDKQRIAELEAAVLEAQSKQEPVAWCVAYDDPRMGRIHSNPTMCEPEVDVHVSKCGGVVVKAPLFAAPVVQPDPVLCNFYQVDTFPDLVAAMEHHIEKLQAKVQPIGNNWPGKVRGG